ncbi:MAG: tetratricopeptide repeat protein, partial [Mycoplasma sp.]
LEWCDKAIELNCLGKIERTAFNLFIDNKIEEALTLCLKGFENNELSIVWLIGRIYWNLKKDQKELLKYYIKAYELGHLHLFEDIVDKYIKIGDYDKALEWYLKEYEKGIIQHAKEISEIYEIMNDEVKQKEWNNIHKANEDRIKIFEEFEKRTWKDGFESAVKWCEETHKRYPFAYINELINLSIEAEKVKECCDFVVKQDYLNQKEINYSSLHSLARLFALDLRKKETIELFKIYVWTTIDKYNYATIARILAYCCTIDEILDVFKLMSEISNVSTVEAFDALYRWYLQNAWYKFDAYDECLICIDNLYKLDYMSCFEKPNYMYMKVFYFMGKFEEAADAMYKVIRSSGDEDFYIAYEELSIALIAGSIYYDLKEYDNAIKCFKKMKRKHKPWYYIAMCYLANNEKDKAIAHLEKDFKKSKKDLKDIAGLITKIEKEIKDGIKLNTYIDDVDNDEDEV